MFFRKIIPTSPLQLQALLTELKINAGVGSIDDNTVQRTVVYKHSPKVVIVASLAHKVPIDNYEMLPKFQLTPEQTIIIDRDVKPKIRYDGDNLLVSDCQYDESDNCIYLEVVSAKYSTLAALSSKKIATEQFFFKTGVMSPLITLDKKVVFIQRNDAYKMMSAPSGFLQPLKDTGELTFSALDWTADLVRGTALKELKEEVFGEPGQLNALKFSSNLGVSIRYFSNASIPTIEFVQPVQVAYTAADLIELLNNNHSEDAHEHSKIYWTFDYSTSEAFKTSLEKIGSPETPGYFLYLPMLETIFPALSEKIRSQLAQFETPQVIHSY